jgi:WD repeat-containing protein 68
MPDEYQLPPPSTYGSQGRSQHQQQHQHQQQPARNVQGSNNPFLINLPSSLAQQNSAHQQSSQRTSMYNPNIPPSGSGGGLPGSLQPGGSAPPGIPQSGPPSGSSARPGALQQSYTTPVVPHINTNAQQYTLPTRSNTIGQSASAHAASHSYSRSSPAGLTEQKYVPFSAGGGQPGIPESSTPKYPQTPNQKQSHYYPPQTPTGGSGIHSPLVLDHIRPRANSAMNDEQNVYGDLQATNSNYVAPWAVFAFDWCKYPVMGGSSAGKMAIGSYLEDPHNFVSLDALPESSTRC